METVVVGKVIDFPFGKPTIEDDKAVKVRNNVRDNIVNFADYSKNKAGVNNNISNTDNTVVNEPIQPKIESVPTIIGEVSIGDKQNLSPKMVKATDQFVGALTRGKNKTVVKFPVKNEPVTPSVEESTFVPYNGFPSPVDGSQPMFEIPKAVEETPVVSEMEQPVQAVEQPEVVKDEPKVEEQPVDDGIIVRFAEPEPEVEESKVETPQATNNVDTPVEMPKADEELTWDELYKQVTAMVAELERLKAENAKLVEEVKELKQQLSTAKEAGRTDREKVKALEDEVSSKQTEINNLNAKIQELENKVSSITKNYQTKMEQKDIQHAAELKNKDEQFNGAQIHALEKFRDIMNRSNGSYNNGDQANAEKQEPLAKVA